MTLVIITLLRNERVHFFDVPIVPRIGETIVLYIDAIPRKVVDVVHSFKFEGIDEVSVYVE